MNSAQYYYLAFSYDLIELNETKIIWICKVERICVNGATWPTRYSALTRNIVVLARGG